jgi:hypothetical protein
MAGDSYSLIIDNFMHENVGRYSITAENPSGKATCSAQYSIEGSFFFVFFTCQSPSSKLLI